MKTTIEEKKMTVVYNLNDMLPEINVDPDRISQVFSNIFVNALRYTPERGKVFVATAVENFDDKQWIKITVSDNGPGIANEDVPYIFDQFYRGEKSRDRKSGGSGLGLAIVKQLVEFHSGTVRVDSSLDEGTTLTIYLPCTANN